MLKNVLTGLEKVCRMNTLNKFRRVTVSDNISVGSVCVFVGLRNEPRYNGVECEVLKMLGHQDGWYLNGSDIPATGEMCFVRAADGQEGTCLKANLKLKNPPKRDTDEEAFQSFLDKVMQPVDVTDKIEEPA
jgi:hypothetical protein